MKLSFISSLSFELTFRGCETIKDLISASIMTLVIHINSSVPTQSIGLHVAKRYGCSCLDGNGVVYCNLYWYATSHLKLLTIFIYSDKVFYLNTFGSCTEDDLSIALYRSPNKHMPTYVKMLRVTQIVFLPFVHVSFDRCGFVCFQSRVGFAGGMELWVKDILNLGVS